MAESWVMVGSELLKGRKAMIHAQTEGVVCRLGKVPDSDGGPTPTGAAQSSARRIIFVDEDDDDPDPRLLICAARPTKVAFPEQPTP